jgi:hypothetical protein
VPSATQTSDAMKAWHAPTGWIVAATGAFGLLLSF